jgi:RNA polymerase sigma-70 factor (ECF subfamily)
VPVLPRVAAGDAEAMRLCLSQFGGIVWSIVRRQLKNPTEAEDLVQEIFIEVWKKAASFNPALASETTFVGLIARRRVIDHLRRQGRRPDFEPLAAAESIPLPDLEKSSVHCDPETVKSSLASLPADTRQLFDLFFQDGFTHPEIAARTGLPLGTVKTRLRRGLIALRERLQQAATPNRNPA